MIRRLASGATTGRVIRIVLGVQLAIGAILIGRDLGAALPTLGLPSSAPRLDTPVRPGDQTRRYRLPDRPGASPMPAARDLPERLTLADRGDGVWSLAGAIASRDASRIVAALDRERPVALRLNSSGGSVDDAIAIGRAIRERGIATEVSDESICLSACPYIFVGGSERSVEPEARVGVHQHYFGESIVLPAFLAVEDIQRGQAEVMAYLDEMGVDTRVMRHAMETPPDQIYLLVPEELERYRIVTAAE